jgi:uncharacterized protein DUF1203
MNDTRFLPIDPDRLKAMRERGLDEFGNVWQKRPAEGWEPLRCCLRKAEPDEDIALICYTPWLAPSPWAEAGPVFVHHGPCPGYPTPKIYPPAFTASHSVLNPFDHSGARAYHHITFVKPGDDHEAAVQHVLSRPDVAFLHVRSSVAGCFTFEATA